MSVGKYLSLTTTNIPKATLGVAYVTSFAVSKDSTRIGDVTYTLTGTLPLGVSLNASGVLSGNPSDTNADGYPFTVTVSGNGYTDSKSYTLMVYKTQFGIFGLQPAVIPTTGGDLIVRGAGFGVKSTVTVGTSSVSATVIDQNTIKLTVPALAAGDYGVTVLDGGESVSIPNALNSAKLLVAQSVVASVTMSATVEPGQTAKVTDYDIVGIRSFYQGSLLAKLEAAFGPQNIDTWRAFGYENGEYFELNSAYQEGADKLRPGSAFWRISRVSGNVDKSGVASESVASYDVVLHPNKWALVSNVYDSSVTWSNVTVLAGTVDAPISLPVASAGNYINQTLWGMNKASTDPTRPYIASEVMEPGKGYWVYNKGPGYVALRIARPSVSTALSKASAKPVLLYKADESLPPEAPEAFQKASISSSAGGGGGGCLLK
jgi:hypothetical protein